MSLRTKKIDLTVCVGIIMIAGLDDGPLCQFFALDPAYFLPLRITLAEEVSHATHLDMFRLVS